MSIAYAQSDTLRTLREAAETVAAEVAAPNAAEVDAKGVWPRVTMDALAQAGLLGLHVPVRLGGHGQGLTGLLLATEAIAAGCSSSGLCYGMHNVAVAALAAKATPYQEERFLLPIAEGKHVSSLGLSESGTGAHFYLTRTRIERDGEHYLVYGKKQFITSGSEADSYIISTMTTTGEAAPGEFNLLALERGAPGMEWLEPWNGFGMRGNSARALDLQGARVDMRNLLGAEGDQIWYIFEVVVPYFIMAMAGVYLGIAQACLEAAINHVRTRRYEHNGDTLAHSPLIQAKVATLWASVEKARRFLYHAAQLGDEGDVRALPAILSAKTELDETVILVANEAMTLGGGIEYRQNARLARLLRDARAGTVMAPTSDILRQWTGRSLLGLPVI